MGHAAHSAFTVTLSDGTTLTRQAKCRDSLVPIMSAARADQLIATIDRPEVFSRSGDIRVA